MEEILSTGKTLIVKLRSGEDLEEFKFVIKNNVALITDVYDGDTVTALCIHENDSTNSPKLVKFRLYGIDTPEKRTRDKVEKEHGLKARDALHKMIFNKLVYCEVAPNAEDQYGRLLVDLYYLTKDGKGASINNAMIEGGFARPYDGGTKHKWEF
jgi:micrococcal nuclease